MAGGFPKDGEYFGQFWGSGVPRFGGGVQQGLTPAMAARDPEPRPGEWCATWGWTSGKTDTQLRSAGLEKQLRPVPRAAAPLLHIDEAIRRLKAKPGYDPKNGDLKLKALAARRSMLTQKPHVPEHEPRGFGSSIKTDRGADPRLAARQRIGGTAAARRTPLRKDSESVNRLEFSAPHAHRRRAKGNAAERGRASGFGASQQTYRGAQSPLCPWSNVDPTTLDIKEDALAVRTGTVAAHPGERSCSKFDSKWTPFASTFPRLHFDSTFARILL